MNPTLAALLADALLALHVGVVLCVVGLLPRRPPKVLHLWPPKLFHPAGGDLMH